ncbi:formylmethanofuran dehydrogenase subunit B [Methanohalophilus levihalophilus]|uniref:formylmethanofuran dehydrogenase subunit B n=1 Tax=Methanohalophilus levihalophilus TaxID=1431282 RepID=UPI001AE99140|nr:formylmethanofuran dehydrogenase subunit B [Methanohalophilus levihalophilus]MBP2029704.1 formylmethanofuran dehydrogenase subunit B [Methanohalophilus levihalophilus]
MVVKNVVCPVCGGSCEDIQVELKDNSITVKNACKMGNGKFQEVVSEHRIKDPMIKKDGKFVKVSWEEALDKAAEILANSRRPLFFMGSETSCEAQEVGLHMGEYLGGAVDSNATICHGPTCMGIQEAGLATSTCGEAKNRSDLNIYWGTNPLASMPRHMSKYALFPRGYWTKRGRFDRKVITVDPRKTDTAVASDLHIQLKQNSDYELLNALNTILNGKTPHHSVEQVTGVPISVMEEMVEMMLEAKFGSVNVGLGASSSFGKHRNIEMALNFIKELNNNHGTKFRIGALRGHCNVAGFNQIASYLYGYPFALDFGRGYPRYNPGETSCVDLLREHDVDAALVLGADLVGHTPADSAKYLCNIPMVCIDIAPGPTPSGADVLLPGVIDAFECDGTFYRLDNVPVYFEPFTDSPFEFTKSNEDTMKQLFAKVKELKEKA